ncbi:polysaccharide deacetylase family protein [Sporosarcina sp. CAU 1771]
MTMKRNDRKKHRAWIDIVFTFFIFSLVITSGVLIFLSLEKSASSSSTVKKEIEVPVIIDSIDSNYPGIKIVTEIFNDPFAPSAIQYPQSIHKSFNQKISTYKQQAKEIYSAKMNENRVKQLDIPGELNISFETFSHQSGNYSFVLVNTSYSGGANGSTEIQSFHLNPKTGEEITIQDLFSSDDKHLELVSKLVREKLFEDPAYSKSIYPEKAQLHTEPSWNNFSNFAVSDEEIYFYFDRYPIAAKSAGVPIVSIPLLELNSVLADVFKVVEEDVVQSPSEDSSSEEAVDEDGADTIENPESSETEVPPTIPEKKRVALTFDDGPDPKVTTQILETLAKYDAKATFFMLGSRVEYYPEIAKSVADAGHELANHSWNHPDLTKLSGERVSNEIHRTTAIIEEVTGLKMTGGFRPPYGSVNKNVRAQTDLPVVLWDVDTLDWKHRNPANLLASVQNNVNDGSIILMHDIHQSTADGLEAMLAYLQQEGFIFVKVSELDK